MPFPANLSHMLALAESDPAAFAGLAMAIDETQIEQDREVYEGSLIQFFARAWREVDPSRLKLNWHHNLIADHLEAVAWGEIRRLVINIPPRCTKSLLANVIYPAWLWAQPNPEGLRGPQLQVMCISYGSVLSMELARTARRLVLSPWYQRLWGHRVKIYSDQSGIENFGTTAGGFRISSSMTGANLGRGGLLKILDDAHKIDDIESETERANVIRIYDEQLTTRETDPAHSAEIILMQRAGEGDLTGHVLGQNDPSLVHLCLPMRYDPERHCATPWGEDPRTREGELLWPAHFSENAVRQRESRMGPFACTPGESPVLMADLSLRPISEIKVGDQLIGFAVPPARREELHHTWRRRRLRHTTVEQVYSYRAPVVKILLDSGETIRCTRDHKWYRRARSPGRAEYLPAERGSRLVRICPARLPILTPEEERMGGWLAGFFDGEGTMSRHGVKDGQATGSITFCQGAGRNLPLCEILEKYLDHFGFKYGCYASHRIRKDGVQADHEIRHYRLKSNDGLAMFQKFMHIVKPNKWVDRILAAPLDTKWAMAKERVVSITEDGEETVYALKTTTGNYVVWGLASSNSAAQYQQSPVPRGGGIIERDWWQAWPDYQIEDLKELKPSPDGKTLNPRNPEVSYVIVSLDTAISEKESADWNACTVWGIWHRPRRSASRVPRFPEDDEALRVAGEEEDEQPRAIMLAAWRRRCRLHDPTLDADGWPKGLVERVLHTARLFRADSVIIENKTRGQDVRDELIRMMTHGREFMLHLFNPKKHGDKTNRLLSTQPLFTAKLVYAPIAFDAQTGAVVEYRWVNAVIAEISAFPRGQHDDFCDSVSMALLWLRGSGLLPLQHEHQQQVIEDRLSWSRRSEAPAQHYGV